MAYDEALADEIRAQLAGERPVTERRMFGGLAFLVHGHMAVCASREGGLLVRVHPADGPRLTGGHVTPMVMRGRPLAGWLYVDAAGLTEDAVAAWVARGVAYARSLPPK